MTFSVTFSEDVSFTRTNIIHDPAFTYRNLYGSSTWQNLADTSGQWDYTRSKFGVASWRTNPSTGIAGPEFVQSRVPFTLYPVAANDRYVFSVWVLADDDCDIEFYIEFYANSSYSGYSGFTDYTTSVPGGVWTRVSHNFFTPTGTGVADIYAYKLASGTPIGINWDGLLLEAPDDISDPDNYEPGPFFDGDILPTYPPANATVGVAWDGTAGVSSSTFTYSSSEFTEDLLSVDLTQGRRSVRDFATPGSCDLEILNPTTIPELDVLVQVFHGTTRIWAGTVRDTEVIYSMVDGLDVLRVSAESLMAKAGRAEIAVDAFSGVDAETMFYIAMDDVDVIADFRYDFWHSIPPDVSGNAYQGSALTFIQRLQTTLFGTILDDKRRVFLLEGDERFYDQEGGGFTDVLPVTDEVVFSGIRFGSKADEYVTKVRVEPNETGLTSAESGDGNRALVLQSFSPDDPSVEELANTYLASSAGLTPSPREITIDVAAQTNTSWLDIIDLSQTGFRFPGGVWHQRQTVTFRGTTYDVILQGFTLSATPDSARITYFMEPVTVYPYLRLNDTSVGILDTNVLAPF